MTDLDSDEYDWRRRLRGGGSGDYSELDVSLVFKAPCSLTPLLF